MVNWSDLVDWALKHIPDCEWFVYKRVQVKDQRQSSSWTDEKAESLLVSGLKKSLLNPPMLEFTDAVSLQEPLPNFRDGLGNPIHPSVLMKEQYG